MLTARDGERLIGVAPTDLSTATRAEFVGHYSICDYMDVGRDAGVRAAFFASILEQLAADGVEARSTCAGCARRRRRWRAR